MMSSSSSPGLRLELDRPDHLYYAGETLRGKVILTLDRPTTIRALTLRLKGVAKAKWTKRHGRYSSTNYASRHAYFDYARYCVGRPEGELVLGPGGYVFDFEHSLAPSLPTSVIGPHGRVRYLARAALHRPWHRDMVANVPIIVIAYTDLNAVPSAREPVAAEVSKHLCCLWCRSGPLTLTVSIPVGGFVRGQSVPVEIELENFTSKAVKSVSCSLVKVLRCFGKDMSIFVLFDALHEVETKTTLTSVKLPALPAGGSVVHRATLTVPLALPSFRQPGVIELLHQVEVVADPDSCSPKLTARLPVLIGSIPLVECAGQLAGNAAVVEDQSSVP